MTLFEPWQKLLKLNEGSERYVIDLTAEEAMHMVKGYVAGLEEQLRSALTKIEAIRVGVRLQGNDEVTKFVDRIVFGETP